MEVSLFLTIKSNFKAYFLTFSTFITVISEDLGLGMNLGHNHFFPQDPISPLMTVTNLFYLKIGSKFEDIVESSPITHNRFVRIIICVAFCRKLSKIKSGSKLNFLILAHFHWEHVE